MPYHLGFDIGGTFTDFALVDPQNGALRIFKALTTPDDPARGALNGMTDFLEQEAIHFAELSRIIHATTLVANALIERKGAKVGLLTTKGFRDIIEIRTEQRYDIFDLFLRYPPPLAPRVWRQGITERVDRDGDLLREVDATEILDALKYFREDGVEAVAVCYLHAFRNPINEQKTLEIIRDTWPEVSVSLSSVVAPEIREYERASTTVANAYVQPLMSRYLKKVRTQLVASGFNGSFYPMFSAGSTAPLSTALEQPIRLVESGPAAGAIAAGYFGRIAGHHDLLAFDMGGTTAKLSLIHHGRPTIAPNLEVAHVHRFKKGSGYPLQFPTVEMLEIGAGGGSIAHIDTLGLLKVGPESASANPGPACYGFGGQQPTVTDADLALGYLNPDYFLGGEMSLDVEAARQALTSVAKPFGGIVQAADGIHRLVNENMAQAARIHVIEQARDPRNYALICFGGAGPVHAAGVANILNSREVIVPPSAGVASAVGLLIAPPAFDFVRSFPVRLETINWDEMDTLFGEMERQGINLLREAGVDSTYAVVERSVDGRFEGQLHEIGVPLPGDLHTLDQSTFIEQFHNTYRRLYQRLPGEHSIELLTWRVTVSGPSMEIQLPSYEEEAITADGAQKGTRAAYYWEAEDFVETPVFDRYLFKPGMSVVGPAIIEERESTTIVRPKMSCSVDRYLNLHIYPEDSIKIL
ncbi:hydantoinase/oxoprolinase family protein [Chloroflexi bacterium TSY]|nr:hydantoinase/oxoprolinase family protein [Chloroflexi bacterium TSY]